MGCRHNLYNSYHCWSIKLFKTHFNKKKNITYSSFNTGAPVNFSKYAAFWHRTFHKVSVPSLNCCLGAHRVRTNLNVVAIINLDPCLKQCCVESLSLGN